MNAHTFKELTDAEIAHLRKFAEIQKVANGVELKRVLTGLEDIEIGIDPDGIQTNQDILDNLY